MRQSKSVHFFATDRDLKSVIAAVESTRRLKYTQAGMFDSPEINTFTSGLDIRSLGFAPSGDSNLEPFWLITDRDAMVKQKVVPQRRGGIRYGVDNGLNPDSILLWPGGVYEDSCVVMGTIGTGLVTSTSSELLKLFEHAIHQQFKRIKSCYVGPEAEQLLNAGYRLAHSATTSKSSDLARG